MSAYVRADPVAVYVSSHDFDNGDIDAPDGTPVALRTGYPHLADARDTERNHQYCARYDRDSSWKMREQLPEVARVDVKWFGHRGSTPLRS